MVRRVGRPQKIVDPERVVLHLHPLLRSQLEELVRRTGRLGTSVQEALVILAAREVEQGVVDHMLPALPRTGTEGAGPQPVHRSGRTGRR